MCYLIVYTIFDFPNETTLKDAANVARALTAITQETDFRLASEDYETPAAAWNAALKRGQRSVYTTLVNPAGYELSFSVVLSDWRRLYVSANRGQTSKPESMGAMVKAGEILYKTLHPDYGFGLVSIDTQPLAPPGAGDYGLNTLHDLNFLSPRLVQKIGAGNLKAVPTYRTTPLDDGGLLLEMSADPLAKRKNDAVSYEAAAMILGIPKWQQGC
jgi:hypothetical protein